MLGKGKKNLQRVSTQFFIFFNLITFFKENIKGAIMVKCGFQITENCLCHPHNSELC